jgi:hypothetical protein
MNQVVGHVCHIDVVTENNGRSGRRLTQFLEKLT